MDSEPKGIGDCLGSVWPISRVALDVDSEPKGIGDRAAFRSSLIQTCRLEADSKPKGIGDIAGAVQLPHCPVDRKRTRSRKAVVT